MLFLGIDKQKPYGMILNAWGFYARLCEGMRPHNQTIKLCLRNVELGRGEDCSDGLVKYVYCGLLVPCTGIVSSRDSFVL